MEKFIYTVTRTRTITEKLVLKDSPKVFAEEFDADSEVEARTMVKGMLTLRQRNKLIWQEISDVIDTPNVQIEIPGAEPVAPVDPFAFGSDVFPDAQPPGDPGEGGE